MLLLLSTVSCSLVNTLKELDIRVTKVGKIDLYASYILIYPENYSNSLSYVAITEKVADKLDTLGFIRVREKDQAKYAFIVTLDFLNKKLTYNNKLYKQLRLEDNIFNMVSTINNIYTNTKKTLIFEAYTLHNNEYNKVFEGYTKQVNSDIINVKELDKGILGFVLCSIDALFNQKIKSISDYQEYYYQCL